MFVWHINSKIKCRKTIAIINNLCRKFPQFANIYVAKSILIDRDHLKVIEL